VAATGRPCSGLEADLPAQVEQEPRVSSPLGEHARDARLVGPPQELQRWAREPRTEKERADVPGADVGEIGVDAFVAKALEIRGDDGRKS
jgi:hypothetical protein